MISTDLFITLSFALSFGAPLVLALRELRLLKAAAGGGRDGGVERVSPAPAPEGDDDLPPLPPSLIPQRDHDPAPRPKVLEPA
ncbi:MAG: hypothetical protein ACLFTG_14740 [Alphaproteobacteria bacterium]